MKRRCLLIAILAVITGAAGAWAQYEGLPGYVRADLQLISQDSLPAWSARWTGPIQAATNLAWLADHGFGDLMRDSNGDGIRDEADTILLADSLGKTAMETETERGTTDPRLVFGLARHVAAAYPNEFVLKIYDRSFPDEAAAQGFGSFSETMVPGIRLELMTAEPGVPAYEVELLTGEAVLVGLQMVEGENNTYVSGRSFLYEQTPVGTTSVDFAWAEEDRWQAGNQGQVLETEARTTDRMAVKLDGRWVPVDILIALSPVDEPDPSEGLVPCPENAIATDTTLNTTPLGSVQIQECVTREVTPNVVLDTYTYYVTNMDFNSAGCGLCYFFIPNASSATTVDMTGPPLWMMSTSWGGWAWMAPLGSCGIQPGETGVFSFTVVGPTTDSWVSGAVGPCVPDYEPGEPIQLPTFTVRTTGPGEGPRLVERVPPPQGGSCPDLVVAVTDIRCAIDGALMEVTIKATATNIGTAPSAGTLASFSCVYGDDTDIVLGLAPGGSASLVFKIVLSIGRGNRLDIPCPIPFEIEVDKYDTVTECDEENNSAEGEIRCGNC